jgi:hypothetical protein
VGVLRALLYGLECRLGRDKARDNPGFKRLDDHLAELEAQNTAEVVLCLKEWRADPNTSGGAAYQTIMQQLDDSGGVTQPQMVDELESLFRELRELYLVLPQWQQSSGPLGSN